MTSYLDCYSIGSDSDDEPLKEFVTAKEFDFPPAVTDDPNSSLDKSSLSAGSVPEPMTSSSPQEDKSSDACGKSSRGSRWRTHQA